MILPHIGSATIETRREMSLLGASLFSFSSLLKMGLAVNCLFLCLVAAENLIQGFNGGDLPVELK